MGYYDHKFRLSFALDAITEHGLPVDRGRQDKLRIHLESEEARITSDIQRLVPEACRPLNRKTPYKSLPKDLRAVLKERELLVKGAKLDYYLVNHYDVCESLGYVVIPSEDASLDGLYKRLEFNPNSSDQLLEYIKWQMDNGPMDVHWYIPTHIDTGKPTVGKEEFNKLIEETGDELLKLARQVKKAITFKSRYTAGDWVPGIDDRVHGVFRFGTAVQQTSCSRPNCFSPDTEILTLRGWIRFDQLLATDYVAQYGALTKHITFVVPQKFIKTHADELCHITTEEQIDLLVTPNHRCLLRNRKTKALKIFSGENYPEDRQQIQAGWYGGGSIYMLPEQLILIAALQADGHILKARRRYKGGGITFAFARQRKVDRLRKALDKLRIPYKESTKKARNVNHNDAILFLISASDVPEWLRNKKFFGNWILTLDKESFRFLADELFQWDGLTTGKNYSSSDEVNTDWAQVLISLTGRRTHYRTYLDPACPNMRTSHQLDITNRDSSMTTNRTIRRIPYYGNVYCVSVPTGYIVTRHNKRVAVTGNCQQFVEHYDPDDPWETDIAEQLKACIRAEPGYKLVNVDMKGFHGRMQGWLAEDPDYYRLASFDLHSFNTAQFVDHPLKDQLRQMNDADLEVALKSIKKAHGHERSAFVKRVSFLNQYGGGADKASRILSLDILLVEKVLKAIAEPFPKVFRDFPRSVDRRMREKGKLISPHGCTRYFWDLDLKQAVAFSVSNPAHCHIQDALIRLFDRGIFARYGACNFPHDSLWYHCPEDLVDECIEVTKEEFEKPSEVLINSLGPFQCGTDAKVGDSLVEMEEV